MFGNANRKVIAVLFETLLLTVFCAELAEKNGFYECEPEEFGCPVSRKSFDPRTFFCR